MKIYLFVKWLRFRQHVLRYGPAELMVMLSFYATIAPDDFAHTAPYLLPALAFGLLLTA